MICFNSKTLMVFMLIGCMAFIADSFTPGRVAGMLLDAKLIYLKSLALGSFTRFLLNGRFPLLFGRKKRETPELEQQSKLGLDRNIALQTAIEAEKYLILAEALDGEKCVQLSLCMAMANANKGNLTEVEQIFVESFRSENSTLEMEQNVLGTSVPVHHRMFSISPPETYVEAANLGEDSQSSIVCRKAYTACKLSDDDLKKVAEDAKNVF